MSNEQKYDQLLAALYEFCLANPDAADDLDGFLTGYAGSDWTQYSLMLLAEPLEDDEHVQG